NSTSAGERGGREPRVDEGSVLLGAPGGPGCTTTGFAESGCWARAAGRNKTATARLAHSTAARVVPGRCVCSRRKSWLRFGVRGKIIILARRNVVTKRQILQPRKQGWADCRTRI